MEIYTNKYNVILNEDKTEAVLNFYQIMPILANGDQPEGGTILSETAPVASLVMTGQCLENLSKSIQELLERK